MKNRQPSTRPLTTSARVHPPFLPYLHNASRSKGKGLKWIPPLAVVVTACYAASSYREAHELAAQQQADTDTERRRREALMADAYGDRGSLEELERAVAAYEAQRKG
ncbi:hypothetical protein N657DRAFT_678794 [Parathielavia appendiculata]|uniref:Uncharacterized protein n=1 Tax=Parathielavia appendiculata TaxID=2587402 RepID=A0AAN6Z5V9_9PEZI|nr:hypothetical protein N657DRAFT_678794 [Parathielavia appendiculata]